MDTQSNSTAFLDVLTNVPGIITVSVAGQQLAVKVNHIIIVEEPERSHFKLLRARCWIVCVLHSCILWAPTIGYHGDTNIINDYRTRWSTVICQWRVD